MILGVLWRWAVRARAYVVLPRSRMACRCSQIEPVMSIRCCRSARIVTDAFASSSGLSFSLAHVAVARHSGCLQRPDRARCAWGCLGTAKSEEGRQRPPERAGRDVAREGAVGGGGHAAMQYAQL
jgi:hypothetical protein